MCGVFSCTVLLCNCSPLRDKPNILHSFRFFFFCWFVHRSSRHLWVSCMRELLTGVVFAPAHVGEEATACVRVSVSSRSLTFHLLHHLSSSDPPVSLDAALSSSCAVTSFHPSLTFSPFLSRKANFEILYFP